ncbi:MAG: hypothetical protein HDS56_03145 [Barnesiella sp.]|nr:hypothetical protein [Barnesiella sp.]MBD5343414.1 hypothetical protein [Bacteroides sp.]MBD5343421.1 hypothetical protein [Bacteroides sp.]MBD5344258.1 hypothetical protein [Bacteroides sp.]
MKYEATITLMAGYVPYLLMEWLANSLPVDLTIKAGRWKGLRVIRVTIEAQTPEDLMAKSKAFNAMIEAQGYGPGANKK